MLLKPRGGLLLEQEVFEERVPSELPSLSSPCSHELIQSGCNHTNQLRLAKP